MPEYVNFLAVFGRQEGPADPLYSQFCEQTMLSTPNYSLSLPHLGRSGRHFQLCYNLKAPAFKSALPKENSEWSIRQVAVHHQFDVDHGNTLWLITRGGDDIYTRVRNLTDEFGRPEDKDMSSPTASFRATLSIHLFHSMWALEQWKPYLLHLHREVERRVS